MTEVLHGEWLQALDARTRAQGDDLARVQLLMFATLIAVVFALGAIVKKGSA